MLNALCVVAVWCEQVDIKMSEKGFKCKPAKRKVRKWMRCIKKALDERKLLPGGASKLAGRLAWAGSHLFKRLGRAMLRPSYDQKARRDGTLTAELERALEWWLEVLSCRLAERSDWDVCEQQAVHLFCDASSSPLYLGAVLVADGKCWCTHQVPSQQLMNNFVRGRDRQIMGFELLAISLGLSSFRTMLLGRNIVVHCDNMGSEVRQQCRAACGLPLGISNVVAGVRQKRQRKADGSRTVGPRPMVAGRSGRSRLARGSSGDWKQHCRFAFTKGQPLVLSGGHVHAFAIAGRQTVGCGRCRICGSCVANRILARPNLANAAGAVAPLDLKLARNSEATWSTLGIARRVASTRVRWYIALLTCGMERGLSQN